MKALDIANWFLSKESMSPKKIQKLVYYAYSWYLTLMNDSEEELTNKLLKPGFMVLLYILFIESLKIMDTMKLDKKQWMKASTLMIC